MVENFFEEEIHLRDYLRVIFKRRWLIAAVLLIVVGFTAPTPVPVGTSNDLKVGQKIKLRTRGGDRWLDCEIARRGINIEDGILTVDIDDGPYSEKDTDVYIHDIRLVETEKGWQPFDVDDEFRAFRKRVEAIGG